MSRGRHPRQTALPTGFGFGPPRAVAQRSAPNAIPAAAGGPSDDLLTIGEVAERYGVTLRTLRFYELKGLIAPARVGATRLYDAAQLAHLSRLLAGKRLGLTLHEIEDLVSPSDGKLPALSAERRAEQIAHLEAQLAAIDAALAELRAMSD